jgi:hypothetical protein
MRAEEAVMADQKKPGGEPIDQNREDLSVDRPGLTPRGRVDPDREGEDSTSPTGAGAKRGQGDRAEG